MKKSVCIATYNGALFLPKSILSILSQLDKTDEIIIVDDASTDDTINILKSFNDPRIKIYLNKKNQGVGISFFRAISLATGAFIFIADQDDIWLAEKVNTLLEIFKREDAGIIVHDAIIIKEEKEWKESLFMKNNSKKGFFTNLISNKYIGCCMALTKGTRDLILPQYIHPKVYHDHYLGLKGELTTGINTYFLEKSLIQYHRHEQNHTNIFSKRKLTLIIKERLQLSWMLLKNYGSFKRVHNY